MKSHQEIRDTLRRLEEGRIEILTDACMSLLEVVGVKKNDRLAEKMYEVLQEYA